MTEAELWTIEQLSDRVADALDGATGQSSGRVREVPDRRTIRWYTTIGLVDRPQATRGRTALYGQRHLLQLVVVKRLQAAGKSLTSIQQDLLGATEDRLAELAGLPRPTGTPTAPQRDRFWAQAPTRAPEPAAPGAVHGCQVSDSVTVTITGATKVPDGADLLAIQEAAAPLLDLLDRLGITGSTDSRGDR